MTELYQRRRPATYLKAVRCIAAGKGSWANAYGYAKFGADEKPTGENQAICEYIRLKMTGVVDAESVMDPEFQTSQRDFFAVVEEKTIIGRINSLRRLPFGVRYLRFTNSASAYWIGEKRPKPFAAVDLVGDTLHPRKISGTILLTDEAVQAGGNVAENAFSRELLRATRDLLDQSFIDPAVAEVADVSPASVTHGAPAIHSSGNTLAAIAEDVGQLVDAFAGNLDTAVFTTDPTTAMRFALLTGNATLDLGPRGGTLFGLPLITSRSSPRDSSGGQLALIDGEGIAFGGDNPRFELATAATVQVTETPDNPVTASTVMVSLWQHGLRALRYEQDSSWKVERPGSVAILDQLFAG